MQIQLPKKPNGSGTEDKYPFNFDKVLRADNPGAPKAIGRLVMPVVERFCQGAQAVGRKVARAHPGCKPVGPVAGG